MGKSVLCYISGSGVLCYAREERSMPHIRIGRSMLQSDSVAVGSHRQRMQALES